MRVSPLATAVSVEDGTIKLEARATALAVALNRANLRGERRLTTGRKFDLAVAGWTFLDRRDLGPRKEPLGKAVALDFIELLLLTVNGLYAQTKFASLMSRQPLTQLSFAKKNAANMASMCRIWSRDYVLNCCCCVLKNRRFASLLRGLNWTKRGPARTLSQGAGITRLNP